MSIPTRAAIVAAAARIEGRVRRTPVLRVEPAAFGTPGPLVLKLELFQHTGSFKPRGAFNRVLSAAVPPSGLIVASGGNAGLATAYVGAQLGHRVEVFVPSSAPAVKVARLQALSAQVSLVGDDYAAALTACGVRAQETGALIVHAYDQDEVVTGQGTLAAELARQAPDLDTVLVAVGGGGLIAGTAAWYAGAVRVVAVEPTGAPTLHAALAAGRPVDIQVAGVAADALGAGRIGTIAWEVAAQYVDSCVLVDGEAVLAARRALWQQARVAAEPGGAVALAALTSGAYRPAVGERVGVLVCGGNSDPSDL